MLKNMGSNSLPLSHRVLAYLLKPLPMDYVLAKLPFAKIQKGALRIELNQQSYQYIGVEPSANQASLSIHRPWRCFWLLKTQGSLGFAQAYFEGSLDSPDMLALMRLFYDNRDVFANLMSAKQLNFWQLIKHRRRHNSLQNSQQNISYHYDLGNDFYRLWLDGTMSYSSAIFQRQSMQASAEQDLEVYPVHNESLFREAQHRKYQRILQQLDVKKADRVLEIGCGWGGMMQTLLEADCQVKGLTLSTQQQSYAQHRLQDYPKSNYEVALQDYRHETGVYDSVVSIEMFEAVGKQYWDEYFEVLKRTLKPSGKAALQIITIADSVAQSYQDHVDFIQAYIFPGGLLPSLEQLEALAHKHGFVLDDCYEFGQDYAQTCQWWKQRFNQQHTRLQSLGYDKMFQKVWNYYLDYCTVGFEKNHINVYQLTLRRTDTSDNH